MELMYIISEDDLSLQREQVVEHNLVLNYAAVSCLSSHGDRGFFKSTQTITLGLMFHIGGTR